MAPLRKAFPYMVGPRVRIRLPPAASLSHPYIAGLSAKSRALRRRSAGGRGHEKGRARYEPGLLRPFSLTGIDAVPPPESSDPQITRPRWDCGLGHICPALRFILRAV